MYFGFSAASVGFKRFTNDRISASFRPDPASKCKQLPR
ncbi:hypothetical protein CLV63_1239 [Murinocardiopsis flavida]|uniref:Uncharacterized protein n=1 Tax=Murinocardiopsis flavida TaxID=645275 RepID=A0A2P8CYZ6_9ACTN|nr:hypothetical protein CLV63_1239 [Murinocardiopsis flavida]